MHNQIINNIKTLGIDMISQAKSGHPGIVLGAAPILYTLYAKHININVSDPNWFNRDRFVMSAGHGSALLYATLFMAGYLTLDDLKNFRKINSKTPGHPELGITPGVDISTGPLGQGFATAVGMALASKKLNQELKFPKKSFLEAEESLIDHKVYVLCSDGDIMEGITSEAASIAGNLKLNNLIVLYDSNNISLDGNTDNTLKDNTLDKFKAMNWNTIYVKNGNDVKSIDHAISSAKKSNKPTIIEFKTIIGLGSELENSNLVHGKPLSNIDVERLRIKLNIPNTPFYVNNVAKENFQKQIAIRSNEAYSAWSNHYNRFMENGQKEKYAFLFKSQEPFNILSYDFRLETDLKEATRVTNQKIMKIIASNLYNFIGGSADLATAAYTYLEDFGNITDMDYRGRNILFGVREQSMGAILNGISTYHYHVFGSTFLSFSDYLKPSIRMSALMSLPVTYIFTHDSINIGQDGPTHQPIEQLASLRAIPNLNVYRPCDANELIGSWNQILNSNHPNCLILSKIDAQNLNTSRKELVQNGAYIIKQEEQKIDAIVIATGTEVHTAIHIARELFQKYQIDLRIVSMPCMEEFLSQPKEYQEQILPLGYKKIVIEAGSPFGWEKFVYNDKYLICLNQFGKSGTKDEILKEMNFDYESIKNKILEILK